VDFDVITASERAQHSSDEVDIELDIKKYLRSPCEDRNNTNPIDWWLNQGQNYPKLAKLALKYLCIPATSTPCERLFSIAGCTYSARRSQLKDETARSIIFLHQNM